MKKLKSSYPEAHLMFKFQILFESYIQMNGDMVA
jgi:hypothetical protein